MQCLGLVAVAASMRSPQIGSEGMTAIVTVVE